MQGASYKQKTWKKYGETLRDRFQWKMKGDKRGALKDKYD